MCRVLVIDDEEIVAEMLADTLEVLGCEVQVANSGREGLSRARKFLPDVITLDLKMPGMDGFKVLEQLKKDSRTRDIPVLIATINKRKEVIERGYLLGAAKYFIKPLSAESLRETIAAYAAV